MEVLGRCLDNLQQIKESIGPLNQFFKNLHRQIEDLSGQRLDNFIRDVSSQNLTGKKANKVRLDALKIRFQYIHAERKASIYLEASEKHIMPGVKLLGGLNSGSDASSSDMERKLLQLDEYHKYSLEGIHSFVEKLPTHAQLMKRIEEGGFSLGE